MWVIKLGGSLLNTEVLPFWLKAVAHANAVIVPGGGAFADTVRVMQQRWGFGEQAAHDMAILSMQQYGRMLGDMAGLPVFKKTGRFQPPHDRAVVWLPDPDALNQAGVPVSWQVTSDSLAAWLAGQLHAEHLMLVKSTRLPFADDIGKSGLPVRVPVERGWIDEAFPRFIEHASFKVWLCCASEHARVRELMNDPADGLLRVV
ncbi:amino acid kinase [Candidatus Methylospira mobilis]|uniref:Amino acid kinase n=1 Tax=Candidatus Methylospira mobilis TaxID=1808979 RepID=A0A5Q0BQG5_9GAMM|nr:amino acid kinase [Candidatus Methylospira mobilis]QFY44328.1 amino acid kinase [Candidatus Methylospira mobilis]WNV06241.1 amino acid kinase [Candidatus Methylospira mobilis]